MPGPRRKAKLNNMEELRKARLKRNKGNPNACDECGYVGWHSPSCPWDDHEATIAAEQTKQLVVGTQTAMEEEIAKAEAINKALHGKRQMPTASFLIDIIMFYLPGSDMNKASEEIEKCLENGGKLKKERVKSVEVIDARDEIAFKRMAETGSALE